MSVRYFQTPAGAAAQYGNLTEDAERVLLDAGYEEITAEEYQAKQEEAHVALLQQTAPADSTEPAKETTSGGDGRKRRR